MDSQGLSLLNQQQLDYMDRPFFVDMTQLSQDPTITNFNNNGGNNAYPQNFNGGIPQTSMAATSAPMAITNIANGPTNGGMAAIRANGGDISVNSGNCCPDFEATTAGVNSLNFEFMGINSDLGFDDLGALDAYDYDPEYENRDPSLWSPDPDDLKVNDFLTAAGVASSTEDNKLSDPTLAELNLKRNNDPLPDSFVDFDLPELSQEESNAILGSDPYDTPKSTWEQPPEKIAVTVPTGILPVPDMLSASYPPTTTGILMKDNTFPTTHNGGNTLTGNFTLWTTDFSPATLTNKDSNNNKQPVVTTNIGSDIMANTQNYVVSSSSPSSPLSPPLLSSLSETTVDVKPSSHNSMIRQLLTTHTAQQQQKYKKTSPTHATESVPSVSSIRLSSSAPVQSTFEQMWQMQQQQQQQEQQQQPRIQPTVTASASASAAVVEVKEEEEEEEEEAAAAASPMPTVARPSVLMRELVDPKDEPDSHDEGFDSEPEDSDHYDDDLSSDAESSVSDESDIKRSKSPSTSSTGKHSSRQERYFWQYNVQAKGPKISRMCMGPKKVDPHELNEVMDPVFSPSCQVQGIKHSGKARRGDGNDLTPNPRKLAQIGIELRKLNRTINDLTPVSELPFTARPKSRKEKNKLASRACRLKKKAQHEANKIKLYGLEQEHRKLLTVLKESRKMFANHVRNPKLRASGKHLLLTEELDKIVQTKLGDINIAGRTADYVNEVLDTVSSKKGCGDGGGSSRFEDLKRD